jgi:hypothetical protein
MPTLLTLANYFSSLVNSMARTKLVSTKQHNVRASALGIITNIALHSLCYWCVNEPYRAKKSWLAEKNEW